MVILREELSCDNPRVVIIRVTQVVILRDHSGGYLQHSYY